MAPRTSRRVVPLRRPGAPERPRSARSTGVLVVSNRLPVTLQRGPDGLELRRSTGGLVSALEPVLSQRGGTWVGWPGLELRHGESLPEAELAYTLEPVNLTEAEVSRYYYGFSNRALWPLLHSLVERARFDGREWTAYDRVNLRFAQRAADLAGDTGFVWIHDYHLFRAPRHLRRLAPGLRIAFFLHTPFPPYDIFRILPWGRELLRGLLACDLVGFHIADYAQNFLDCTERLLGARVDRRALLVEEGDRTCHAGAFPLGIDFDRFEQLARLAPAASERRGRIILGVDRLDYTKGIPERIRAFERLLELHPDYREQLTLVQIAVPTRSRVDEYRALKRQIDELVGRVNGRFGTATWTPIRYLYQSLAHERLATLYRDADVAFISPLRDGMNLVAKEYVACQVANPGVLVVSNLAGTAETMHEAIRVNPYNVDGSAAALHRALSMDEAERWSRLAALRRRERRDNVYAWVEKFLAAALHAPAELAPPTGGDFETWLGPFLSGYRLALFLACDGALGLQRERRPHVRLSAGARRILEELAERPDSDVTVLSGRPRAAVAELLENTRVTAVGRDSPEMPAPVPLDRGQAVLQMLRSRYGAAWSESVRVVYVGNEDADEEAFRLFAGLGFTFRVGSAERQTYARRRLPNMVAVEALLRWLAERPSSRAASVGS